MMKGILKRIGLALVLSVAYISLVNFLLWTNPFELGTVLLYNLIVRTVYFLGLDLLYSWIVKHLKLGVQLDYVPVGRYIGGLFLFTLVSFVLLTWLMYWAYLGWLRDDWTIGLRLQWREKLLYYVSLVVPSIYYTVRCFFDALAQLQRASIAVERYQLEKAQAHLTTLKSQISPHFLFNSLNALSSLIHTDEEKAVRFVEELATIFRYVLVNKEKELVPLRAEVEFLNAYLYLLRIRFRDNLRVTVQIPAQALTAQLPPLTLQLLIENAIKHNVVSKDDPLWVEIVADGKRLTVRNNLQLREKNDHSTGVGLNNITQRYRYLTEQPVDIRQTEADFIANVPLLFPQESPAAE